jgi:peptidoglycan/LPS O-acetylase OafA/YrhL
MAGSLGYLTYKSYGDRLKAITVSNPWLFLPFVALALDYTRYPYSQLFFLLWFPMAFIMIPILFAHTNRSRTDRLIGELSYPCYLMHVHVLTFTVPLLHDPHYYWARGPLSIAITLMLSLLYYLFIESKTERFRENLYRKSHPKDFFQPPASRAAETPASSLN